RGSAVLVEEPQLEDARRVEAGDPELGASRGRRGAGRHQPDELDAVDLRSPLLGLALEPGDDLVERGRLPVLHVHAHLHAAGPWQVEPERPHPGEAAVAFPYEHRKLAGGRDGRPAEVDIEGDQRWTRPNDHPAG